MVMKNKKQAARMSLQDELLFRRYVKNTIQVFQPDQGQGLNINILNHKPLRDILCETIFIP